MQNAVGIKRDGVFVVTKGLSGRRCQPDLSYTLPKRAMLEFRTQAIHPLVAILCPPGPWRCGLRVCISLYSVVDVCQQVPHRVLHKAYALFCKMWTIDAHPYSA